MSSAFVRVKEGFDVVDSHDTSCEHIFINPTLFDGASPNRILGLWTVTHRPSGFSLLDKLPNRELAELAAKWLMALPVDWSMDAERLQRETPKESRKDIARIRGLIHTMENAQIEVVQALGGEVSVTANYMN